jgi:hypothetical protein
MSLVKDYDIRLDSSGLQRLTCRTRCMQTRFTGNERLDPIMAAVIPRLSRRGGFMQTLPNREHKATRCHLEVGKHGVEKHGSGNELLAPLKVRDEGMGDRHAWLREA